MAQYLDLTKLNLCNPEAGWMYIGHAMRLAQGVSALCPLPHLILAILNAKRLIMHILLSRLDFVSFFLCLALCNVSSYSICPRSEQCKMKIGGDLSQRRHDLFWRLFVSDTWIVSADLYIRESIKASHRSFFENQSSHMGRPASTSSIRFDIPPPPKPRNDVNAPADLCMFLGGFFLSKLIS